MEKRPSNGGKIANRGFIFQTIVAEIQCLERKDWDAIKVEPETTNDKVDIILYSDGKILSAIQVKSSINPFERSAVRSWFEKLCADAGDAEEICLYLVGKWPSRPSCEEFIAEHPYEIMKISFDDLQTICTGKLVEYINKAGVGGEVRVDDLELLDDVLFSKLFKNSIAKETISRMAFEERFQKALPIHIIPKRLTPIPTINHVVGLVGRDDIKKSIREMLEINDCIVLVSGLGGIGKTAVMQHVCNELKNEGKYVAWIECGGSLKEELLLLRTALGIPESDNADVAYVKIINELKTNRQLAKDFYIFLDNLSRILDDDEQEVLNGIGIHVMATSRLEHTYFMNIQLDVLAEEHILNMFYGYYLEKQKDKTRRCVEAALDIVRSVQKHTLLVELLAKAAWKKGGNLEAFRDALKARGAFDVFQRKLNTKHDKNRTIEECVMKLYEISHLSHAQQHIMKLFTVFTPEKEIYYKICEWADLDMDAMDEIVDLGWLERGGLESGYQIHQIVRDSIARQMEKNGETVKLEDYGRFIEKVVDTDSYLSSMVKYELLRERIVLAEDVASFFWRRWNESKKDSINIDTEGELIDYAGGIFNNLALVYKEEADYDKSLEYFKKAVSILEGLFGSLNPVMARIYNNMAGVYRLKSDDRKALEYYLKALTIDRIFFGMDHLETEVILDNIAGVYNRLGEYSLALKYHEKALAIEEKLVGTEKLDTAITYGNIANVYQQQGNHQKALEYYEKEIAILCKLYGTEHIDVSYAYNNIAMVYRNLKEYEEALKCCEKALAIAEKNLGYEHPKIAELYNNIAGLLHEKGDYEEALSVHKKAIEIREKFLGLNHMDTANSYNNIAEVYGAIGDYEKALEYLDKACNIVESILGVEHLITALIYNNIADIYKTIGNYNDALNYYHKAYTIREKVFGPKHPSTKKSKRDIEAVSTLLK